MLLLVLVSSSLKNVQGQKIRVTELLLSLFIIFFSVYKSCFINFSKGQD